MVEVRLPTVLRPHAGGASSVAVPGSTLRAVLEALTEQHPDLRGHLFDDGGALQRFVNVYRNDDDVRYLDQLDTKLGDGDVVSILPAVAGG